MALEFNIPDSITVHLGVPTDTTAQNVTVPFTNYVKNVASSEIYPTWPENALIANIYAQITFALNRIYTAFYRSQGYPFDITNTTQYDQKFINGRDFFENVSRIVDDVFNSYLTREGELQPIYARYCNGTTSTCPGGLSQWGSVDLANQGYQPMDIIRYYYGDDVVLLTDVEVTAAREQYPGVVLRVGDLSSNVKIIQLKLNRISRNYPAIPKIANPDGYFDAITEQAVMEFQRIFNLSPDGLVGRNTWYEIARIYNAVARLSELDSEGIKISDLQRQFSETLQVGDDGPGVLIIQYYLNFISQFNDFIPPVDQTGYYGAETEQSVRAFQQAYNLPVTGIVDEATWNELYSAYFSITAGVPDAFTGLGVQPYPGVILRLGMSGPSVRTLQEYLSVLADTYSEIPKVTVTGTFDRDTQNAVIQFQTLFGLPVRGVVGPVTWDAIAENYASVSEGSDKSAGQFPGYTMSENA